MNHEQIAQPLPPEDGYVAVINGVEVRVSDEQDRVIDHAVDQGENYTQALFKAGVLDAVHQATASRNGHAENPSAGSNGRSAKPAPNGPRFSSPHIKPSQPMGGVDASGKQPKKNLSFQAKRVADARPFRTYE